MTPKYKNLLSVYTLSVNESPEAAEYMAQSFEEKFDALDKYTQLSLSLTIEHSGFESAFLQLEDL